MRLRRETGDFQIRINPSNGTNAIRTGLSAEDFAGELININGTIEPVLSVSESEGVVTAKTASYTVTYNKETGAITSSEGGAGGSGGGKQLPEIVIAINATRDNEGGFSDFNATIEASDLTFEEISAMANGGRDDVILDITATYSSPAEDPATMHTRAIYNIGLSGTNPNPFAYRFYVERDPYTAKGLVDRVNFEADDSGNLIVTSYMTSVSHVDLS